jgi:hypothetical protein
MAKTIARTAIPSDLCEPDLLGMPHRLDERMREELLGVAGSEAGCQPRIDNALLPGPRFSTLST